MEKKRGRFEAADEGFPYRARMLRELDDVLKRRRCDCLAQKGRYFRPNFESLAAFSSSLLRYRDDFRKMLGWPLTDTSLSGHGKPKVKLIGKHGGSRVYRVWIPALNSACAYGILLLPSTPPPWRFVISQHGGQGIPEITADLFGSFNYNRMSVRIAESGYAVFCPQLFLSWKRHWGPYHDQQAIDFQLKQLGGSLAALHIHILGKITDWILERNDVEGQSVAIVGLSYGGFNALNFAALDSRVATVVASCIANDSLRYANADRTWFGSAARFGYEEICSMICPRPLYLESGIYDALFPPEGARYVGNMVKRIYRRLKVSNHFKALEFDGKHEFNPNKEPILFLKKHFSP